MDRISWGIKVRYGYNGECKISDYEGWGQPLLRRVNRASHENAISEKKKLAREVTKGKSEVDFLDINEVIGRNIKG